LSVEKKSGENISDRVTDKDTDRVTNEVTNEVTDEVTNEVTDNQRIILEKMINNPTISAKELSSILEISLRKTKENIAKLRDKGLIERVGSNKSGYWKTIADGNINEVVEKDTESGQTSGQTGGMTSGMTSGMTGGMTGGMTITDTQERIIDVLKDNPKLSYKKMSEILNISVSALQKQIEKLKQMGIIEREGADFGGYWKIITKNE
jgi:predicted HTH transcriptional regulator